MIEGQDMLSASTENAIIEARDRTRRIETRLTKFLEGQGFDTGVQRPVWDNGEIEILSKSCSIADLLNSIPKSWKRPVNVYIGDEYLFTLNPN